MPRLRPVISRPRSIEGFAIVSTDGMIADANGEFPSIIKSDADYAFFHDSLDRMQACVHGRRSYEDGPHADRRSRLIVTRSVPALAPDTELPNALCWNPQGASFEEAWRALGIPDGSLAVVGGTDIFGMFLTIGYDVFNLTRVPNTYVGNGRPVFPAVPQLTPEAVLQSVGLKPSAERVLDAEKGVTLTAWRR